MADPLFTDDLITPEFIVYLNEKLPFDCQFTSHIPVTGKGFQNIVHVLKNNCNQPVAALRIFSSPQTASNEILCLTAVHEREHNNGHNVCPKILFSETDKSHIPFSFVVQEYLSGETLTRGHCHDMDFIRDAATVLHEIHTVTGPPMSAEQAERDAEFWPSWAVGLVKHVPQSQVKYMELREKLDTHLADLMEAWRKLPRTTLVHGDPNVGNFLRTPDGGLRLLDWEMSGSNHRLLDVAAFITSNELTTEEERAFLTTYYALDSPGSTVDSSLLENSQEASLLWLFKVRRLFALIAYFVMLFSKTPVTDATLEKRLMLQATLDNFVTMFADCADQQLVVDIEQEEEETVERGGEENDE